MNAAAHTRLALLALSVALFAAVWSGDQRHRREAAGSATGERPGRVDSADSPAAAGDTPVSIGADDVPLPAALQPGVYRIVSTGGAVRTARFTADDLLYLGVAIASASSEVPAVDDVLHRWYFIRLDEEAATERRTVAAGTADAPLCRATKLLLAWAAESGSRDLGRLAEGCEDSMAGAIEQWQDLARTAADDLQQALGRVYRPAEISTRPRDDERL